MKLSIIIPNYNYGNYIGAAIDSALALDWPDKEIIVVDDGSTDNSREIIRSYDTRITPLLLSNGGQSSACNAGFARCSGDIIIFLDADDVLFGSVADTLRSAWSDRVSKLQWSLAISDENLRPLGRCSPTYWIEPTPEGIRRTVLRTGHYHFSTNGAWARRFLRQVFPVPARQGNHRGGANGDHRLPVIDHYLSTLAPFFGDVVCISPDDPQGAYRMHGDNNHVRADSFEHYAETSLEPFECADQVNRLLSRLDVAHQPISAENEESFMKRQLICQRLNLQPRKCTSLFEALRKYWRSIGLSEAPLLHKVKWCVWSIIVAGAPEPVTLWAIRQRRQGP